MHIDTSAPTRIDLAGGTIDIWPLYLFHAGAQTLNAAISLRARARIETRSDQRVVIHSEDTKRSVDVADWSELREEGELRLLSLLTYWFLRGPEAPAHGRKEGLTLTTRSESPAGGGIAGGFGGGFGGGGSSLFPGLIILADPNTNSILVDP